MTNYTSCTAKNLHFYSEYNNLWEKIKTFDKWKRKYSFKAKHHQLGGSSCLVYPHNGCQNIVPNSFWPEKWSDRYSVSFEWIKWSPCDVFDIFGLNQNWHKEIYGEKNSPVKPVPSLHFDWLSRWQAHGVCKHWTKNLLDDTKPPVFLLFFCKEMTGLQEHVSHCLIKRVWLCLVDHPRVVILYRVKNKII
jgi:hypothetical protein